MNKSQRDTIVGIDPGPTGFAWAEIHDGRFVGWGEIDRSDYLAFHQLMTSWKTVAIEDFVARRGLTSESVETIKMIGWLQGVFPDALLVTRLDCAMSLGFAPNQKRGDSQIIRALHMLYPQLRDLRPLKTYNHIYAACAVAHCAVGKLQAQKVRDDD